MRRTARGGCCAAAVLLGGLLAGCAGPRSAQGPARSVDLGCFGARDTDLSGRDRCRALGPLLETRSGADGSELLAVRPLFSRTADPTNHVWRKDWLWPVGTSRIMYRERSWRFLVAYGDDFDCGDPDSRYRFVVFPLLFVGRDAQGEGYAALFPLGGTLHEYLGQDRMAFVLFPLYAKTNVRNLETHHILWPIVSWTDGDDVSKFRVFPFYGQSRRGTEYEARFVLWPFWTSLESTEPGHEQSAFMLFPVWGRKHSAREDTWLAVPPFFRWSRTDRGNSGCCPWPFIRWSAGEKRELTIWPLWGRKQVGAVRSSFLLWPVGWSYGVDRENEKMSSVRVVPLLSYEHRSVAVAATTNGAAGAGGGERGDFTTVGRYLQVWPLFSYRRENDAARFRALDLWPVRDTAGIERNWAPLWTLYSCATNRAGTDRQLLWGLWRHRAAADGATRSSLFPLYASERGAGPERDAKVSLLMGLVRYEKESMHRRWRLLYFVKLGTRPSGGRREAGTETPQQEDRSTP